VLVVGHERSATSWVGQVLGQTANAGYILEPDTPGVSPYAARAVRGLGCFPVLDATEAGPKSLRRIWDAAFGGTVRFVRGQQRLADRAFGPRDDQSPLLPTPDAPLPARVRLAGAIAVPRHVGYPVDHYVVKTVRAPFMLDWIRAGWNPAVVVCCRHPLDVVASFLEMFMGARTGEALVLEMSNQARARVRESYGVPEPTGTNPVPFIAWRVGVVMSCFEEACRHHPELHRVEHAVLCSDPPTQFRQLADALGLDWTPEAEEHVGRSNRPGTRYELARVASEQQDRWRTRLDREDARLAALVLEQFPISARYADLLA
jgi:hypothetical protein